MDQKEIDQYKQLFRPLERKKDPKKDIRGYTADWVEKKLPHLDHQTKSEVKNILAEAARSINLLNDFQKAQLLLLVRGSAYVTEEKLNEWILQVPADRDALAKMVTEGHPLARELTLAALPNKVAGKEKAKDLIEKMTDETVEVQIIE